jgi:hypothetical protein
MLQKSTKIEEEFSNQDKQLNNVIDDVKSINTVLNENTPSYKVYAALFSYNSSEGLKVNILQDTIKNVAFEVAYSGSLAQFFIAKTGAFPRNRTVCFGHNSFFNHPSSDVMYISKEESPMPDIIFFGFQWVDGTNATAVDEGFIEVRVYDEIVEEPFNLHIEYYGSLPTQLNSKEAFQLFLQQQVADGCDNSDVTITSYKISIDSATGTKTLKANILGAEYLNLSGIFTSNIGLKIFELPESLIHVNVIYTALYALAIPSQLKILEAESFYGQALTGLPSTLEALYLNDSYSVEILGTLPASLQVIDIQGCGFTQSDLDRLADEFVVGAVPKKSWVSTNQATAAEPSEAKKELLDANVKSTTY